MESSEKTTSDEGSSLPDTLKLNLPKPTTDVESPTSANPLTVALALATKSAPPNKKAKMELTKAVIKGASLLPPTNANFIPSVNFFTTKAAAKPGAYFNFTISNGEFKPSNGPAVSAHLGREKRIDTNSGQKPIIVTVSGLPGSSTLPVGAHQVQIACKEGDKNPNVAATITSTNAASILSALSSALPNVGNSDKPIPIVVATAPTLCKGSQASARIISVPVLNSSKKIMTGPTYKKIEPKPPASGVSTPVCKTLTPINSAINIPTPSPPTSSSSPSEKHEDDEKSMTNGDKSDPNSKDYDPIQAMDWVDGIATLPGSNIKFKMNEFGTLELAMDESECQEIKENKPDSPIENGEEESLNDTQQNHAKETSRKRKAGKSPPVFDGKSGNDIQNCLSCGSMGIREEFYDGTDFCSQECLITCSRKIEMRKKRKERLLKKKKAEQQRLVSLIEAEYNKPPPSSPCSSEESIRVNIFNDDSNPPPVSSTVSKATKYSKGFSWKEYLDETKAVPAPSKLFRDYQDLPYVKNQFKINMKLEGIDPKHPSLFCVLTVVEVVGFRMRLHFDGYSDCYDFWVNADSSEIFPVGWCEKTGHKLQPPKGHAAKLFNWGNYLRASKAVAAPKNCFYRLPGIDVFTAFRTGMKLEAVDKKNSSLVCVATIMDTMADRFLVHFDGWDDMYDYWADPQSPYIHPINWCRDMGHVLTPPNNLVTDYKDSNNFTWERYLEETNSTAVATKHFKERQPHEFKFGMKTEIIDKRNPVLIRVATIVDTQPHAVKIHFDGWSDDYDYWVDDDSPDLHPPAWCQNARYPLQPPQKNIIKVDQTGCPTPGCMGIGHIKGPKYTSHHSAFGCPYSQANMNKENSIGDRLGTGRSGEAVFIEPLVKKSEAAVNAQQESKNSPESQARFRRCPTPGCNGMGHVTGKFTVHHRVSGCPLAVRNSQRERTTQENYQIQSPDNELPDAPLVNVKLENNLVLPPPIQLANSFSNKRGRKKFKSITNQVGNKNTQVCVPKKFMSVKKLITPTPIPKAKPKETGEIDKTVEVVQDKVHHSVFTTTSIFHPVPATDDTSLCWNQHSLLLPGITQMPGFNVTKWNANEVASFVAGLTGNLDIGKMFSDELIDGESLMLLNQTDITKVMTIKLGPALKIYNSILMFRKRLETI